MRKVPEARSIDVNDSPQARFSFSNVAGLFDVTFANTSLNASRMYGSLVMATAYVLQCKPCNTYLPFARHLYRNANGH